MVGWDNTARRPRGATIFDGATPEAYARWLEATVASLADVREEERYLFVLAWNEWAEGNHLEPDQHYGRAFLEATRGALIDLGTARTDRTGAEADRGGALEPSTTPGRSFLYDSPTANAVRMIREIIADPERLVVGVGTGPDELAGAFG